MKEARKSKKHLLKHISLWPLKSEEALAAFMKVDPANVQGEMRKLLGKRAGKAALPNG